MHVPPPARPRPPVRELFGVLPDGDDVRHGAGDGVDASDGHGDGHGHGASGGDGDGSFGHTVERWTLTDGSGVSASILTYGAILQELRVPDPAGQAVNVVLGFDRLRDYVERSPYFGCVVGRYANRIAGGRLPVQGTEYRLPLNDGPRPNTLHGGTPGFGARLWTARPEPVPGGSAVVLSRTSPDGEEGFPGTLDVEVRYALVAGRLSIDYRATTDAPTVVNLSSHAHFNLAGEGEGTVLGHELTLDAAAYLPVDEDLVPTGETASVEGTPFDFRTAATIGSRIDDPHEQLKAAGGYDHCWTITGGTTGRPRPIGLLRDPASGRTMRIATTEPGIQVYPCGAMDGTLTGPSGRPYLRHAGVALETQHYPDSPNHPEYPSTVLLPTERYRSTTVLDFSRGKLG